ncbi:enoyl-CoA-hydratase DpgD [Dyella humi]|uniref:Enoyl-CoA hydratase/isomerase family protein n=1 Tax=Dyella humi TaxID=1770547 RepID=A0ABW8IDB1_9GAMM
MSDISSAFADSSARVIYEKRGRVGYVTLNRPASLNAMDLRMHEELCAIWDDVEQDDSVWLAVLTGAGDRAFSVGMDLKELAARAAAGTPPTSLGNRGGGWPRLTERHHMRKPIIAKVNGLAIGGGFELALACDIIIASEHAQFALPEAKLGLIPGAGGVFRLTRQIPFKAAMGYLFTGRKMSAGRAYDLGLVNEVAKAAELDSCVEQWITDILACAPLSIRAIKQIANQSAHLPLEEAFRTRYEAEQHRLLSSDCAEGARAFVEKRPPSWTGA